MKPATKLEVFGKSDIKYTKTIFGMADIISNYIFAFLYDSMRNYFWFFEISRTKRGNFPSILFFCVLNIVDAILLIVQIITPETILTTFTIGTRHALIAPKATFVIKTTGAFLTVYTLITVIALYIAMSVRAHFRVIGILGVKTIFIV